MSAIPIPHLLQIQIQYALDSGIASDIHPNTPTNPGVLCSTLPYCGDTICVHVFLPTPDSPMRLPDVLLPSITATHETYDHFSHYEDFVECLRYWTPQNEQALYNILRKVIDVFLR